MIDVETFVFHDPTEARKGTLVPDRLLAMSKPIPRLEELSGADFIITTDHRPPRTPALLKEHVESGCLLIQRKSGDDLVASLDDRRLFLSLFKMIKTTARTSQRVLLTTGLYAPRYHQAGVFGKKEQRSSVMIGTPFIEQDEQPVIDWRTNTHMTWERFQSALSKMIDRGIRLENVPSDDDLPLWFEMKRRHLTEYATKPMMTIFPEHTYPPQFPRDADALQIPNVVKDWRFTLSTVPGFGAKKCESVAEYASGQYVWPMLSNSLNVGKYLPRGIGPGLVSRFRKHFGIDDGFCLELVPEGHWRHCGIHNILFEQERSSESACPMCKQDNTEKWSDDVPVNLEGKELPGNGQPIVDDLDDNPPWSEDDDG